MASGLESRMASEMTSICMQMVSGIVTGLVSSLKLGKGWGMPSESKLIGHVYFEEIDNV